MLPFDLKQPLYGFRAKCPHAWRHIHLFTGEKDPFVFFRPRNAEPEWLGTFWGDVTGVWAVEERDWGRAERRFRPLLSHSHIWRVLQLPDPREGQQRMWWVLWRPDFGYVTPSGRDDLDFQGAYFWPRPAKFNLWKTPTRVLREHFEREWHDPLSDVRAALPWCDLTDEEREEQSIVWKKGNWQELEQLTHAAVRLISFWDELDASDPAYPVWCSFLWDGNGQHIHLQRCSGFIAMNPEWKCWRRLCSRIEEHYRGAHDLPNGSRNDWILPWVSYEPPRSARRCAHMGFEVSEAATQHERMEASLILRDWLRENAPDLMGDWFP